MLPSQTRSLFYLFDFADYPVFSIFIVKIDEICEDVVSLESELSRFSVKYGSIFQQEVLCRLLLIVDEICETDSHRGFMEVLNFNCLEAANP